MYTKHVSLVGDLVFYAMQQINAANLSKVEKHDYATHAFLFWEGFDEASKRAAGKIFSASPMAKVLIVVTGFLSSTKLEPGMARLGFGKLTCSEILTGIQVSIQICHLSALS